MTLLRFSSEHRRSVIVTLPDLQLVISVSNVHIEGHGGCCYRLLASFRGIDKRRKIESINLIHHYWSTGNSTDALLTHFLIPSHSLRTSPNSTGKKSHFSAYYMIFKGLKEIFAGSSNSILDSDDSISRISNLLTHFQMDHFFSGVFLNV